MADMAELRSFGEVMQNLGRLEEKIAAKDERIRELEEENTEVIREAMQARTQRDGLRSLLGTVYRALRDGREISRTHMMALEICYDRRRSLEALNESAPEEREPS